MSPHWSQRRRRAAAVLLGALLLFVFGAAVDPIVHLVQAAEAQAAALAAADGDAAPDDAAAPFGSEHDCIACKLARAHALPTPSDVAFATYTAAAASPAAGSLLARAPPALASSQARAPPQS